MIVVAGPRIDPQSLASAASPGLEISAAIVEEISRPAANKPVAAGGAARVAPEIAALL